MKPKRVRPARIVSVRIALCAKVVNMRPNRVEAQTIVSAPPAPSVQLKNTRLGDVLETQNTVCSDCSLCTAYQTESQACTSTQNRVCANITTCDDVQYVTHIYVETVGVLKSLLQILLGSGRHERIVYLNFFKRSELHI